MTNTITLNESDLAGDGRLQDADVRYVPDLFGPNECEAITTRLIKTLDWQQFRVRIAGREIPSPRLTAWYGNPGVRYSYSGLTLEASGWPEILATVRERVETLAQVEFNSVLANLYRDGSDSMGWHSDAEPELGRCPVIASMSFGATRRFSMRHRKSQQAPRVRLDLESGSLLLMSGLTQHHWRHAVHKTRQRVGPRVNLTFRRIVAARPHDPKRTARKPAERPSRT